MEKESQDVDTNTKKTDVKPQEDTEERQETDGESGKTGVSNKRIAIIVFCVVVVLLLIAGVACATGGMSKSAQDGSAAQEKTETSGTADGDKQEEVSMVFNITAEGWDAKTSTKFSILLTNRATKETLRFEIEPNKDQKITAPAGDYEIEYISGVNADGSMYSVPGKSMITFDAGSAANPSATTISVDKIEADKVTEEDKAASTAGENKDNAQNTQQATPVDTPSSSTDGTASNNSSSASSSTSAAPEQSAPSAPAHTHTWVEQTSTQWVPNVVTVTDSAAWDEPVYETVTHTFCNGCGADITNDIVGHMKASGRYGTCQSYHNEQTKEQTGTVHHDAVTHSEDQGHNETVVTGYVCSGCGATK